jgi:hypothetical protein
MGQVAGLIAKPRSNSMAQKSGWVYLPSMYNRKNSTYTLESTYTLAVCMDYGCNKHSENGIELWRSGRESPFIVVYRLNTQ